MIFILIQKPFEFSQVFGCSALVSEDSMLLTHDVSAFAFQCIYSKPGDSLFTCSTCAAVLHHNQSPEFYDEVRRRLASHLSSHRNVGVTWLTEPKPRLREVMNLHKKSSFINYLSRWSLLLLHLIKFFSARRFNVILQKHVNPAGEKVHMTLNNPGVKQPQLHRISPQTCESHL